MGWVRMDRDRARGWMLDVRIRCSCVRRRRLEGLCLFLGLRGSGGMGGCDGG